MKTESVTAPGQVEIHSPPLGDRSDCGRTAGGTGSQGHQGAVELCLMLIKGTKVLGNPSSNIWISISLVRALPGQPGHCASHSSRATRRSCRTRRFSGRSSLSRPPACRIARDYRGISLWHVVRQRREAGCRTQTFCLECESLIVMGTPWSVPQDSPRARAWSASLARRLALSSSSVTIALSKPLCR